MRIFGIDLGTSNSVIAEYKRGQTEPLLIAGKATIPSVIYLKNGNQEIGQSAKGRLLIDPKNCISSAKRHLGTNWTKKIEEQKYTAADAAEMMLSYIKSCVLEMEKVVITIPAYFEEKQKKETMEAAKKAGLDVLRLLPEPTAAAIRYGFDKEKDQTILVLDLGGGTFDVSILTLKDNSFIVKAVDGNSKLGGDDFDNAIVDFFNSWIKDNLKKDITRDLQAQQKLKEEAERAKISLSVSKSEDIYCEVANGVIIEFNQFTRKQYQALIQNHLDEIIDKTESVIAEAGLTKNDIGRFVLVGGSCKHPVIQELIKDKFKTPYVSSNMDTAVAEGAAIVCASLLALESELNKSTGKSAAANNVLDEGDKKLMKDFLFEDVVSHSLGIDMNEKTDTLLKKLIFVPIISKNTKYPCKGAVIGMTDLKQEEIRMSVFRGENENPKFNTELGELVLKVPQKYVLETRMVISAIFEIDVNGLLTFTSVEMPVVKDSTFDEIKTLCAIADNNQSRVEAKAVYDLKDKYNYSFDKIEIKL